MASDSSIETLAVMIIDIGDKTADIPTKESLDYANHKSSNDFKLSTLSL